MTRNPESAQDGHIKVLGHDLPVTNSQLQDEALKLLHSQGPQVARYGKQLESLVGEQPQVGSDGHSLTLGPIANTVLEQVTGGGWGKLVGTAEATAGREALTHIDIIAGIASRLPDGTIKPSELISTYEHLTHQKLDGQTAQMLDSIDSITKSGDHFEFAGRGYSYAFHKHAGPISSESLDLGKSLSFDLSKDEKGVHLNHIKGLSAGTNLTAEAAINDVTLNPRGADGQPELRADISNPLPGVVKALASESSNLPVDFEIGPDGKVKLKNRSQLEDALFGNPLVKSVYDTGNSYVDFWEHPSVGTAFSAIGNTFDATVVAPVQTVAQVFEPWNW